jgi:hypothetical protein
MLCMTLKCHGHGHGEEKASIYRIFLFEYPLRTLISGPLPLLLSTCQSGKAYIYGHLTKKESNSICVAYFSVWILIH